VRTGTLVRRCVHTRCRVPWRVRDEVLQRLILPGIAQPAMHRLHRLPLAVAEQAVEILTGRLTLRAPAEAGAEAVEELAQPSQECPRGPRRHARSVRDLAREYKRNRQRRFAEPDKVVLARYAASCENSVLVVRGCSSRSLESHGTQERIEIGDDALVKAIELMASVRSESRVGADGTKQTRGQRRVDALEELEEDDADAIALRALSR
jgi:hypothetical protein